MANFDSGVCRYIEAKATVRVSFPVDWNGKAEIACKHCPFFVRSTMRCGLNQSVVNFPEKYVGEFCPLQEVEENV